MGDDVEEKLLGYLGRGQGPQSYEIGLFTQHFDRIMAILEGKVVPPYEIEIQPTSRCNLRCKWCFGQRYIKLPDLLTLDNVPRLVRKVTEFEEDGFGIDNIKFCGSTGEPLLNEATIEAIKRFKDAGKKVILFSNGVLLDKEIIGDGKHYYDVIAGMDRLTLSLDADCEETFRRVKETDGFERIIGGLEKLMERRDGLTVEASYVITEDNLEGVFPAALLMKLIGVDNMIYRVDFTDPAAVHRISDKIIENISATEQLSDKGFNVISAYDNKSIEQDNSAFHSHGNKCYTSHFWASIGPDLRLYACGHRTHGGVKSYGSLLEHSLRELWTSKERQEGIARLPDRHCVFCSPGSARRNEFMTYLSTLPTEQIREFYEKHVVNGALGAS